MCAELERFVFNGIDTYRERDIVFLCCWLLFAWWLSNYHRHIATNERMNVWLNGCHPYCTTQLMALLTYIFFFSTLLHQITQISDSISGSQSSNNQNERSYYTSKEEKWNLEKKHIATKWNEWRRFAGGMSAAVSISSALLMKGGKIDYWQKQVAICNTAVRIYHHSTFEMLLLLLLMLSMRACMYLCVCTSRNGTVWMLIGRCATQLATISPISFIFLVVLCSLLHWRYNFCWCCCCFYASNPTYKLHCWFCFLCYAAAMLYIGRYGQWWEKEEEEGKKNTESEMPFKIWLMLDGWMGLARTSIEQMQRVREK